MLQSTAYWLIVAALIGLEFFTVFFVCTEEGQLFYLLSCCVMIVNRAKIQWPVVINHEKKSSNDTQNTCLFLGKIKIASIKLTKFIAYKIRITFNFSYRCLYTSNNNYLT